VRGTGAAEWQGGSLAIFFLPINLGGDASKKKRVLSSVEIAGQGRDG